MIDRREREAADRLRATQDNEATVEDTLRTNDRVIARVTDGIYRRPGSAIRELVANAYDADATRVSIKTDAPRFGEISVEDNGIGMTPEAVVHLLQNIGGSAKRTSDATELGISTSSDNFLSPGGRRLIGKLGIGLFSVSQLTQSFEIITKTRGDEYQTIVLVQLHQFDDARRDDVSDGFATGKFQMWRQRVADRDLQGTTIRLTSVRPQTRAVLSSEQLWAALDNPVEEELGENSNLVPPAFHIGRVLSQDTSTLRDGGVGGMRSLPWEESSPPDDAMARMVDAVWDIAGRSAQTAKLSAIFDEYFQTIWNLALALPLQYVEGSLLDQPVDGWASVYRLSNEPKGTASKVVTDSAPSIGAAAGWESTQYASDFEVSFDGIRLRRPLKYHNLPVTNHALTHPLVFVGDRREEFTGISEDVSAGALAFRAYLFWNPRIAPTEHQGVLVRIHGSSGTLFDQTFFGYQVSELTRLRQTTCEVFVDEGLEAALNIDRESFNAAHPHTVVLRQWIHSALRQLATAQKREAAEVRGKRTAAAKTQANARLASVVKVANDVRTSGEGLIPRIRVEQNPSASSDALKESLIQYDLNDLRSAFSSEDVSVPATTRSGDLTRLEAIAQILVIFGAFDALSPKEQQECLAAILAVLETGDV